MERISLEHESSIDISMNCRARRKNWKVFGEKEIEKVREIGEGRKEDEKADTN